VRDSDELSAEIPYDFICIASGAAPHALPQATGVEGGAVLSLRDTDSVASLAARLGEAGRVMVVGNGGIALELMCATVGLKSPTCSPHLQRCTEKLAPRHRVGHPSRKHRRCVLRPGCGAPYERHHSSITIFQGAFLQQVLAVRDLAGGAGGATGAAAGAQLPLSGLSAALPLGDSLGSAVGPRWAAVLLQQPGAQSPPSLPLASVHAEMGCEVSRIEALAAGPLRVQLSNGTAVDVATVVNATGVVPAVSWCVWRLCKTLS